ncbi:hypothetical protein CC80DRAFT_513822 [Byssothecium circinans]|uniref:SPX domain-containing protein n=1 Tax=Byssothecium circinans TaxID=147558 RepID=A0A6A5U874_9PLEO|nr:hypothetical protein CC80DRAFT_513822 [Byssothecium circinans]
MKYGDTLRRRSPEWAHFNIDYDYLKDLIKHQTSTGTRKAVSIPGQGATSEKAFGDTFYHALKAQHDRIYLFIRSKSGEIERRLEHIDKSIGQLQSRRDSQGRLPACTIERFAKIDADVTRAGEEIRSLSRFQIAQRTGFRKILKKYKRWTNDRELERRFQHEVTGSPESFYQLDLGHVLDQYISVLGALRAAFEAPATNGRITTGGYASSPSLRVSQLIQNGTNLDFDLALSLTPLGDQGSKATYWIHKDHILEVEVLLLHYMRLFSGRNTLTTGNSSKSTLGHPPSSPNLDKHLSNEDPIGLVVLDHPGSYAIKQNASTIGASEETTGTLQVKAVGGARWTSSSDATITVNVEAQASDDVVTAQLKRKELPSFLGVSAPFNTRQDSGLQEHEVEGEDQLHRNNIQIVQRWLSEHHEVKPIAGLCSKRTRFVGLHNNNSGGMWAFLDRDVFTKASLPQDLGSDDWLAEARNGSTAFPHAVLQIRREGTHSAALIQTLDCSHLLERVRGFSLEAHAVWTCCRPEVMAPPIWMPLLDQDIRKLPPAIKRQKRKDSSVHGSITHVSPPQASISATSPTDGFSTPYTPRGETSATSAPDFVDPPPLQAFRKKRKPYADYPPPIQAETEVQGYWNEYDNPASEDEGYYIYIDPSESNDYPGQKFFEACAAKVRWLFGMREVPDEVSGYDSSDSSDDEAVVDERSAVASRGYGTFGGPNRTASQEGYFSSLFRTIRNPQREFLLRRETEHERRSLLTELQVRQHKTEMAKLRFYSTCLLMATVINAIITTMTATSRRKERGVVAMVILFGTIFNVLLCGIALVSMKTRHESLGWVHQGIVGVAVGANFVIGALLVRWVFGGV